jgi:hypothetical protein
MNSMNYTLTWLWGVFGGSLDELVRVMDRFEMGIGRAVVMEIKVAQ